MDNKKSIDNKYYTYQSENNSNWTTNTINNNSYDWTQLFNTWCQHLLPCGLCAKTDRPCPKYQKPTWDLYTGVTGSTPALNDDITISKDKTKSKTEFFIINNKGEINND